MPSRSTTEEKSAEGGTVSTWAVGIIGAVAVVVASVWGAHIGAQKTADATFKATSMLLAGETERSRAEFLRGQRQELYSRIAEKAQALNDAERECYEQLRGWSSEEIQAKGDEAIDVPEAALEHLQSERFYLEVIGSDDMLEAFTSFIHNHGEVQSSFAVYAERWGQGGDVSGYIQGMNSRLAKLSTQQESLVEAARADMGAD